MLEENIYFISDQVFEDFIITLYNRLRWGYMNHFSLFSFIWPASMLLLISLILDEAQKYVYWPLNWDVVCSYLH